MITIRPNPKKSFLTCTAVVNQSSQLAHLELMFDNVAFVLQLFQINPLDGVDVDGGDDGDDDDLCVVKFLYWVSRGHVRAVLHAMVSSTLDCVVPRFGTGL